MKPEHFIYKSDGLYYIKYMPEYPSDRRDICGMIDPVYLADIHQKALERAKAEAIRICDEHQEILKKKIYDADPGRNTGVDTYFKEGEIYTINMEEKIEVVEVPADSGFPHIDSTSYPTFRKIARIEAPKNEPDHECTMDLMTDVCVYSCECGKIEVASNLSYHDKPKTYIPESAPKKEQESEHQWNIWREAIEIPEKMRGMEDYEVIQELEKHFEIKRKPL